MLWDYHGKAQATAALLEGVPCRLACQAPARPAPQYSSLCPEGAAAPGLCTFEDPCIPLHLPVSLCALLCALPPLHSPADWLPLYTPPQHTPAQPRFPMLILAHTCKSSRHGMQWARCLVFLAAGMGRFCAGMLPNIEEIDAQPQSPAYTSVLPPQTCGVLCAGQLRKCAVHLFLVLIDYWSSTPIMKPSSEP